MEYIDIVHTHHSIIYDNTVYMYNLFGSDILSNHITIMHGFEDLITLLYKVHGFESPDMDVVHYNVFPSGELGRPRHHPLCLQLEGHRTGGGSVVRDEEVEDPSHCLHRHRRRGGRGVLLLR